ncbi:MAG: hypothetical protein R6U98_22580 [Pirellulaceae bacterium]
MESRTTQAVLPLVGLATDTITRDGYNQVFHGTLSPRAGGTPAKKAMDREMGEPCHAPRSHPPLRRISVYRTKRGRLVLNCA